MLECRTLPNVIALGSGVGPGRDLIKDVCVPLSAWLQTEMIYLGGSLAGPQIVLNGGVAAVKAAPLRGRLCVVT